MKISHMWHTFRGVSAMACFLTLTAMAPPQKAALQVHPETGETQEEFAARTKWWREVKFGMFIHWGLYAVPANSTNGLGEWYMNNWQRSEEHTSELQSRGLI